MDPILQLVERSCGVIDPTLGSKDMSARQMQKFLPTLYVLAYKYLYL